VLALLAALSMLFMPTLAALLATPTSSSVFVDSINISFDAYNINGSNYFKLRDVAFALKDSEKQFSVDWDEANNAIILTSGETYKPSGGEMASKGGGNKVPVPTSSKIIKDGKEVSFDAYNIDGNNYFKLRDIGAAFDFEVDWLGAIDTIIIDTTKGYDLAGAKTPELTKDILKLFEGGTYHMKLKFKNGPLDMSCDMYSKYNMAAIEMDLMGPRRIVYKYGKVYSISDTQKTVSVTEAGSESQMPMGMGLDIGANYASLKYIGEGSGSFLGKTYSYDEFESAEGEKMLFFVENEKLVGIRSIDKTGRATDIEVLSLDQNVPNSVFDIPTDYQVTGG